MITVELAVQNVHWVRCAAQVSAKTYTQTSIIVVHAVTNVTQIRSVVQALVRFCKRTITIAAHVVQNARQDKAVPLANACILQKYIYRQATSQ
jgi:hypothetical protein